MALPILKLTARLAVDPMAVKTNAVVTVKSCGPDAPAHCARDRGYSAHPVFPAPSIFMRDSEMQTPGALRRENAMSHLSVVVPGRYEVSNYDAQLRI